LIKVTVTAETHSKLRRAQDLLRHSIPTGDPAMVLDRALTLLVQELERKRTGTTKNPRLEPKVQSEPSLHQATRHVPAAVKRTVWARDQGRCTFKGSHGRCTETGHLEFHHLVPFAHGGPTDSTNLALRCRAHNHFEGELVFGPRKPVERQRPTDLSTHEQDRLVTPDAPAPGKRR
jgi:5-methylcytosine-specific restriction endonuclease McrA